MKIIRNFLDKYIKTNPNFKIRNDFIEILKNDYYLVVNPKDIIINNGVIYLKIKNIIKSEILINKSDILIKLNKINNLIKDLR